MMSFLSRQVFDVAQVAKIGEGVEIDDAAVCLVEQMADGIAVYESRTATCKNVIHAFRHDGFKKPTLVEMFLHDTGPVIGHQEASRDM